MRHQTAFQTVENIVDLKQSRLSTHSQCSVKILNIAQIWLLRYYYLMYYSEIRHGDKPHNYVSNDIFGFAVSPDEHYRLKSVSFFLDTLYHVRLSLTDTPPVSGYVHPIAPWYHLRTDQTLSCVITCLLLSSDLSGKAHSTQTYHQRYPLEACPSSLGNWERNSGVEVKTLRNPQLCLVGLYMVLDRLILGFLLQNLLVSGTRSFSIYVPHSLFSWHT